MSFVRGERVDNPRESIKLFALCESMKWAHLPVAGGIYDQHPQLLEEWHYIFAQRNEYEAEKEKKQRAEAARSRKSGKPPRPSRHR